jgi:hypothetical protein
MNYSGVSGPTAIANGDLNRDGHPDLVVAQGTNIAVTVFFGLGDGTFAAGLDYPAGVKPAAVAIGDLNGDGWPEVVTANADSGGYGILWNRGAVCGG